MNTSMKEKESLKKSRNFNVSSTNKEEEYKYKMSQTKLDCLKIYI